MSRARAPQPGQVASSPCARPACLARFAQCAPLFRRRVRETGMSKGFLPAIMAGAAFALLATPAFAADDIAAKAQVCAACHGENGTPTDPKTMPIIWGQQSNYLYKELQNYHSGERKSPIMQPVVQSIS